MPDSDFKSKHPWFRINYNDGAPRGLPPIFQASRVCTYRDDESTWLVALWDAPAEVNAPANCILRVRSEHIGAITEHPSLAAAATSVEG